MRELINVIERAMLLTNGERIQTSDLPLSISQHLSAIDAVPAAMASASPGDLDLPAELLEHPWNHVRRLVVDRVERAYIAGLLEKTRGRVGETARLAGMQPRSLFEKMRHHGLCKESFRSARDAS